MAQISEKSSHSTIDQVERNGISTGIVEPNALGLVAPVQRNIGTFEIICIGWNICVSWAALAGTLVLTVYQGGNVTLIYGIVLCFFMIGCSGLTMAELASVYPTAGGQYHWTSVLAPKRFARILSYTCGLTNIYAWIAATAGIASIVSQGIIGLAIHFNAGYIPHAWHTYLVFLVLNAVSCIHNVFTLRRTLWINDVAFFLTLSGFVVIVVTCLSLAPSMQSNKFVWTTFTNNSGGWPDGVSFLVGLVSPNFMYAGLDGAIHLCEECKDAARVVPRAIVSTIVIGFVTSFAFAVAMLYCIQDFTAVLETPTGFPIYEVWHQATRSPTAAIVFLLLLLIAGVVALFASQQTSSRLTWSFARDSAIIGHQYLGRVHSGLEVPVWALIANNIFVSAIGCVFLGSTNAFNAFVNTGLILQQITIAFPATLLLLRGRSARFLPPKRSFKLPGPLGWSVNIIALVFAIVVLIFYNFPVQLPVSASNMNYASAVIGGMISLGLINWFVHASKSYHGPRLPEL